MNVTDVNVNDVIVPENRVREKQHDPSSLADSIAQQGLLNPITVRADLTLIAGYHRLAAVKELGWMRVPANVVALDDVDAELAEIDENLRRHDLSVWEQSKHVARREELMRERGERAERGGDGSNQHGSKPVTVSDLPKPKTTSQIAMESGMSDRTWQRRAKVGRSITPEAAQVIDDIDPESCSLPDSTTQLNYLAGVTDPTDQLDIATRVADGSARDVWEASKQLKRERNKEAQLEREAERAKAASEQKQLTFELRRGDFTDALADLDDHSVDLILTDPPYGNDAVTLYGRLADFAATKLKPGGHLITYAGQATIADVIHAMTPALRYWWCIALTHGSGLQQMPGKWVQIRWKPILWFVNGKRGDRLYVDDLIQGSPPRKDLHAWAQGTEEVKPLIDRLTDPGGLIVDPFAGSGSFGHAANDLGRHFIGADDGSHEDAR